MGAAREGGGGGSEVIRAEFDVQMLRMAGLRFMPADLETHWEGLRDLPLVALEGAVGRAVRSQSDFPTPAELRVYADAIGPQAGAGDVDEPDRRVALDEPKTFTVPHVEHPLRVTHEWRYDCEVCSDLGMRTFWCGEGRRQPWIVLERCERRGVHQGHEWVRRCECYDTNATVQRRIAGQAKYAASGAQKRAS